MAMKHGHENWKTYHMEETTTKTEQKRKMITLTEKQDNKKQSKLKKKHERKPNNTLNEHSNKKHLLNAKTSSITEPEIKIK
jgi:hypothetical protein